ncbi:MAG: thiamine pyrophosphate-dependent enzyme [Patescibacteria group bacterium]|nr:thiamine pyrophosphate-dependent enzyme [Patescibacteria group bacterium]
MNKKTQKFTVATTCAGCPIGLIIRTVLNATDDNIVVANATGCMEVTSTIYPNTAWNVPYIHSAFGNTGATISGIETAYRSLKKQNKLRTGKPVKFVAFGGDGGTYDIGLQALSGALERGHDFLYICYDNGAYMNTGNQRSGATPIGADTETTPSGKKSYGKRTRRKDMMSIVAAHHIPYVATANVGFLQDFEDKVKKAFEMKGPKFILVFSPCVVGWKYEPSQTIDIAKQATETNFWPLFEIENGRYYLNYEPKNKLPIEEFYKTQGRFKHIFRRQNKDEILGKVQEEVDNQWKKLQDLTKLNE